MKWTDIVTAISSVVSNIIALTGARHLDTAQTTP